jgi:RNA polymerase sigma factor (sigma-70 family)
MNHSASASVRNFSSSAVPASRFTQPALPDRFSCSVICRTASRLKRRTEFRDYERQDIIQQLWLCLLQNAPQFDGRVHWNAYAVVVVETAARKMLRELRALKRTAEDDKSSVNARDESPAPQGEWTEQDGMRRRGREFSSTIDAIERTVDVHSMVKLLPQHLRPIAEALQHTSVTQLAREYGIPRTTLIYHIAAMRAELKARGIS